MSSKIISPSKKIIFSIITKNFFKYIIFILFKSILLFLIWSNIFAPVFPLIPPITFGLTFLLVIFLELIFYTKSVSNLTLITLDNIRLLSEIFFIINTHTQLLKNNFLIDEKMSKSIDELTKTIS